MRKWRHYRKFGVTLRKILVLHGPNLNLLGNREPTVYGTTTLQTLDNELIVQASHANIEIRSKQTNSEYDLIELVQQAAITNVNLIIINAAAYTHTSIALRDALLAVQIPFIEVHISNIYAREDYRKISYLSDIAIGIITGFGTNGYKLALQAAIDFFHNTKQTPT